MRTRLLFLTLLGLALATPGWSYPGNCGGATPCTWPSMGYQTRPVGNQSTTMSISDQGIPCHGSTGLAMHETLNPSDVTEVTSGGVTGPYNTQFMQPDIGQSLYGNASATAQCGGTLSNCFVGDGLGIVTMGPPPDQNVDNFGFISTPSRPFINYLPTFGKYLSTNLASSFSIGQSVGFIAPQGGVLVECSVHDLGYSYTYIDNGCISGHSGQQFNFIGTNPATGAITQIRAYCPTMTVGQMEAAQGGVAFSTGDSCNHPMGIISAFQTINGAPYMIFTNIHEVFNYLSSDYVVNGPNTCNF